MVLDVIHWGQLVEVASIRSVGIGGMLRIQVGRCGEVGGNGIFAKHAVYAREDRANPWLTTSDRLRTCILRQQCFHGAVVIKLP